MKIFRSIFENEQIFLFWFVSIFELGYIPNLKKRLYVEKLN